MKLATVVCIAFCILFWWPTASYGQLLNGDFEDSFSSAGIPNYWRAGSVDNKDSLQDTTHLSPFTNIYPLGASSVHLVDDNIDGGFPSLIQDLAPSLSQFNLSFDFSLDAVKDAEWALMIGSGTSANFILSIDATGLFQFDGTTYTAIAVLTPGTWYQFAATVDDTTRLISGSLTSFGGTPVPFSGLLYLNGPTSTGNVKFQDLSPNQNPTLYVDNVSVRDIPEPSTVGFLIFVLALAGVFRPSFQGDADPSRVQRKQTPNTVL